MPGKLSGETLQIILLVIFFSVAEKQCETKCFRFHSTASRLIYKHLQDKTSKNNIIFHHVSAPLLDLPELTWLKNLLTYVTEML